MFIGECKLYIINIPDLTETKTLEGGIKQTVIKEAYKHFEPNSLILNIAKNDDNKHEFYAVNDSGDITFVKL